MKTISKTMPIRDAKRIHNIWDHRPCRKVDGKRCTNGIRITLSRKPSNMALLGPWGIA